MDYGRDPESKRDENDKWGRDRAYLVFTASDNGHRRGKWNGIAMTHVRPSYLVLSQLYATLADGGEPLADGGGIVYDDIGWSEGSDRCCEAEGGRGYGHWDPYGDEGCCATGELP